MQQDQPTPIDTELMISDEASGSGNDANGPKTDDYNRIDFSTNEQTFISLLLAILANMLIDFSPCKEVITDNLTLFTIWFITINIDYFKDVDKQRYNQDAHRVRRL